MKKENSLLKAGVVLVVSGFIVKLLGALYRIPLTRMLGAAQMGRYSALFSLFMPFFSFATAGIVPCTAHFSAAARGSKAVASVGSKSALLYIFQSSVMAVCFVCFGCFYSYIQSDSIFFTGSIILAPAIVLAAAENICKGLTQGQMDMLPTAVSNVLESTAKTVLGLSGVYFAAQLGKQGDGMVKAALGAVTVAGFICCAFLLFTVRKKICNKMAAGSTVSTGNVLEKVYILPSETIIGEKTAKTVSVRQMLGMSFPIAVSALVISLSAFFDTAVCIPRIDGIPYSDIVKSFEGASFKNAENMPMYLLGIYQGMVLTVFNLLPAVLSYIGTASLPVISRAAAAEDKTQLKWHTARIFTVTASVSVPVTVFIYFFRYDILQMLFGTNAAQTQVSAKLLGILLWGSVFCCFTSVFNSVLYAAGRSALVFRILLLASAVKCMLNYILCGIPQINIKAFAVSACIFNTIIFVLSVINIKKLGAAFSFGKIFFMPCAAAALSMGVLWLVNDSALCFLPPVLKLAFSAAIFALVYFLIAIITGFMLISVPENSNI
ncbi:MAG: oligosaccharide flippase family protein [Oscillospiraceae bacterium]|nr:oligosaccharide flippase family protein [Oscillospiraceae bacterium]